MVAIKEHSHSHEVSWIFIKLNWYALPTALSISKVREAFNNSHLYPLYDGPHYTKEEEDRLLQQVIDEDRHFLSDEEDEEPTKKRGRKKKHMEGLLTTPDGFKRLKEIIASGELNEQEPLSTVSKKKTVIVIESDPCEREVSVNPDDKSFRVLKEVTVSRTEKRMSKRLFGNHH